MKGLAVIGIIASLVLFFVLNTMIARIVNPSLTGWEILMLYFFPLFFLILSIVAMASIRKGSVKKRR